MMKRFFLFLAMLMVCAIGAQATNRFVTETGANAGSCTSGVISRATFNSTTLSPDDVVLFCGTIAGEVDPQSSGTSGHPIVLKFDTGAKWSVTVPSFSQFLYLAGLSFITIDGGTPCGKASLTCNGQITYTQMGSAFGSGDGTHVAIVSGAHDIEIKNLEWGPFYLHTPQSGYPPNNYDSAATIYGNNPGANIHIHDCKFHDNAWTINLFGSAGTSQNYEIDHNYFQHTSHGVNLGTSGAVSFGGLKFHDNFIMDPVNWDQTNGSFHHDGLQITCTTTPCTVTNIQIYNNTFGGDWGCTNTSPIFLETHEGSSLLVTNVTVFNNLFQNANTSSCGWANGVNLLGHSGVAAYNNTIICASPFGGLGLQFGGSGADSRNNIVTGCQLVAGTGNEPTTIGTLNYNLYANWIMGGGGNAFSWNGTSTSGAGLASQLTSWKALIGGGVEANSITATGAGLNSDGTLASNSPAINSGTNLTSLGIAALDFDKNGNPRPNPGNWDMGAFNNGAAPPPPVQPAPPTGLTAVPH